MVREENRRPNILLAISDDQSWRDAGAYGHATLRTPVFDRIAREGALFTEDLGCLRNLVDDLDCADIRQDLANRLNAVLQSQGDPRALGYGDIFDSYPHYAPKQPSIGGFKQHGEYNPDYWRLAQDQCTRPLKQNKVDGNTEKR